MAYTNYPKRVHCAGALGGILCGLNPLIRKHAPLVSVHPGKVTCPRCILKMGPDAVKKAMDDQVIKDREAAKAAVGSTAHLKSPVHYPGALFSRVPLCDVDGRLSGPWPWLSLNASIVTCKECLSKIEAIPGSLKEDPVFSLETQQHPADPPMYYIQNCGSRPVGNCALWWRPEGNGYTCDINSAWLVTKEQADRICSSRPEQDIPHLASDIRPLIRQHVDVQDLGKLKKGP